MSKSTAILEKLRGYKVYSQQKLYFGLWQMDSKLDAQSEINDFSPGNTREHTAWMAGYLRGVEAAENEVAEFLYPTSKYNLSKLF